MTVVTANLPEELLEALEKKAKEQDRSKSWLIRKALEYFLNDETAYLLSSPANAVRLEKAIQDIEKGKNISKHDLLED